MKTLRELIALPVFMFGWIFVSLSCLIGGYDFGADLIENLQNTKFKRK